MATASYTNLPQVDMEALMTALQGLAPGVGTGYLGAHRMGEAVRPEPEHSTDPDNPTCWLEVALVPQAIDGTLEDRANPGRFATLEIGAVAQAGAAPAVFDAIATAASEKLRTAPESGFVYLTGQARHPNSAPQENRPQAGFLRRVTRHTAVAGVA